MVIRHLILRGVAIASLATALAFPVAAAAQDASDTEEQGSEIVVTGFRSSLTAALNDKREESGVVDVIRAEDIAKFPDANLAESLQRVPGVALSRDSGEGRSISVRGLGPDFTRVRLNGLEAQSLSTGIVGLVNRGRGFDFSVFASELFNELIVRKTPSAEVEDGSLGATVDLRTARPFDHRGFNLVASLKGDVNEYNGRVYPRGALLVSDTFADDTFGILVSAAYNKSVRAAEGYNSGQWDTMASNNGFCDPTRVPTATNPSACFGQNPIGINVSDLTSASVFHPRFPRYGTLDLTDERMGLTVSLQWKPSDRTLISIDGLYARQDTLRQNYYLTAIGFNRGASQQGKPEMVIREGEIRGGSLVYARIDNIDLRSENESFDSRSVFHQIGLEAKHEFSDTFRANLKVGRSRTDFDELDLLFQADRINSQGYVIDMRDSRMPSISYGFDVMNPANFYIGPLIKSPFSNPTVATVGVTGPDIRIQPIYIDNSFEQGDLNVEGDISDDVTLKMGGNYRVYEMTSDALRLRAESGTPVLPVGMTNADLMMPAPGLHNFDLPTGVPRTWMVPSVAGYDRAFGVFSNTGRYELTRDTAAARANIWGVTERNFGTYVQTDFKFDLGSWHVRGDMGVRYVHTRQSSTGYQETAGGPTQVNIRRSYENVLPAANIAIEPNDELVLRVSAAKVVNRVSLSQLVPSGSVNATAGTRSVTTGNPMLDPIRATTIDVSAEWYFAPGSIISLGGFYKNISTYVQTLRVTRPFSSSGLPASVLSGTSAQVSDLFDFISPVNTDGGTLKGVELNFQAPLRFLPGPLRNLGVLGNYTFVESDIDYIINANTGAHATLPLINLSKHSVNGTIYYEDSRFSARVSANYRSSFLRAVPARGGMDASQTGAAFAMDASISYKVNDHFSLSVEALNLTNPWEYLYEDSVAQRPESYRHFGRQFFFGLRYNY